MNLPTPAATGAPDATDLRERLLAWFDEHRRDLPWRTAHRPGAGGPPRDRSRSQGPHVETRPSADSPATPPSSEPVRTLALVRESGPAALRREPVGPGVDPYRVWVAEAMLVQTQVDTVIPYYLRFIDRFPDVGSLARGHLDEVLKLWEGLGYYARARNLHRAAGIVSERLGGDLPTDEAGLRELPGIGPYMAAAIRAIAFGAPALAVDGNVRRVLSRVFDLPNPKDSALRELATDLVADRPGDVNQGLMDLGATICRPRSPLCPDCPLEARCLARARDTVSERPGKRRARPRPHRDIAVGVIWRRGEILIARRRPEGLLGGLWEFPGGKAEDGESLEAAVAREVREELGIEVDVVGEKMAAVDHTYSHFAITLHAYPCRYRSGEPRPLGCDDFAWVRPEQLDLYAFPAANRRILELLGAGWR